MPFETKYHHRAPATCHTYEHENELGREKPGVGARGAPFCQVCSIERHLISTGHLRLAWHSHVCV